MSATKLDSIEICDFRGFPEKRVPAIELGGKNLLLYGENGSGKSTIFHALAQLLDSRSQQRFDNNLSDARCLKNRFTDPTLTVGRVELCFTQASTGSVPAPMVWGIQQDRPTGHIFFSIMARTAGFLDYRAVFQTHFVHHTRDGINLFSLIVDSLLRDVEYPTAPPKEFGEEWDDIRTERLKWLELASRDPNQMDEFERGSYGFEALEEEDEDNTLDFVAAFRLHVDTQREQLGERIDNFNNALWQRILEIQHTANRFLSGLDSTLEIDFEFAEKVKSADTMAELALPGEPALLLRAKFHGELLEHPGTFLNEARLTAIALTFYLAALKVEVPEAASLTSTAPRLLVLDDVLIGLDMSHRMPILALLETEFVAKDWQVFLLTYDRVWFELAQLALQSPDRWVSAEMYSRRDLIGTYQIDVPVFSIYQEDIVNRFLSLAQNHVTHDARTAAFYARVAFEAKLKAYCHDQKVQVPYDHEGKHLTTDHFLHAIERRLIWTGTMPRALFMLNRVKLFRGGVLNPLAHFHPVTLATAEVEAALHAVSNLEFPKDKENCTKRAAALLRQPTLTQEELVDAACWLRTAFEVDLRHLLKKYGGKVAYRHDWAKDMLDINELWGAAKEAMTRVNSNLATSLITNIETHTAVFLVEWSYATVGGLNKTNLDAAWNALRDVSVRGEPKTRLATFR